MSENFLGDTVSISIAFYINVYFGLLIVMPVNNIMVGENWTTFKV